MSRQVQVNEATAANRRVYFHLVGSDGVTPATGEAGGQPQISSNGAAWTNTGVGTLTAIGNGRYYADLTTGAVATSGVVIETRYKSASTAECPGDTLEVVDHDPFADVAAIRAKTDTLGSASVTLTSPVSTAGTSVTIIEGDDYLLADSRSLEWTDSGNTWPTLTGASVTFGIKQGNLTYSGSVVTATGSGKKVRVELTAAQTAAIGVGTYGYDLFVTLSNTHKVTLVSGTLTVLNSDAR